MFARVLLYDFYCVLNGSQNVSMWLLGWCYMVVMVFWMFPGLVMWLQGSCYAVYKVLLSSF